MYIVQQHWAGPPEHPPTDEQIRARYYAQLTELVAAQQEIQARRQEADDLRMQLHDVQDTARRELAELREKVEVYAVKRLGPGWAAIAADLRMILSGMYDPREDA